LALALAAGLSSAPLAQADSAIVDGTYEQACRAGYARQEIFAGENAIYVEKNFADGGCKNLSLEIRSYGRVVYSGALEFPRGASAIDFSFLKVTLVPAQEWVADLYRKRNLCGVSNWRVGEETEITGRSCDFFGLGRFAQVPEAGEPRFGIYAQEANGTLYLGQLHPERDGKTPERRPRNFDPYPYLPRPVPVAAKP